MGHQINSLAGCGKIGSARVLISVFHLSGGRRV
jgi:hypothetical protein